MEIFIRKELKYLITRRQMDQLLVRLERKLEPDPYFESDIYSVYFDTDQFDLLRQCADKPDFRQKVRIRSYRPATESQDLLYLENKKKTRGICHKNRSPFTLEQLRQFLQHPRGKDQASRELVHVFERYDLRPQFTLHDHRYSYIWKSRADLRLTFDDRLSCRTEHNGLFAHESDRPLLERDQIILEIKGADALPLELSRALFELSIRPASFSKAGQVYRQCLERKRTHDHDSHKHLPAASARL